MINRKFVVLSMLMFILFFMCSKDVFALSLTFDGLINDELMHFTVYGNVDETVSNHEWGINSISEWALLPSFVPSNVVNNDNAYGQMLLQGQIGGEQSWNFRYHELINGSNASTRWGHEIDIRITTTLTLDELLKVSNAFSYVESSYGDSGVGMINPCITGTLSLIGFDLDAQSTYIEPPYFGGDMTPVPEPSSLILLSTGLLGIIGLVRKTI